MKKPFYLMRLLKKNRKKSLKQLLKQRKELRFKLMQEIISEVYPDDSKKVRFGKGTLVLKLSYNAKVIEEKGIPIELADAYIAYLL